MNALLDINILLDVLLAREPWVAEALALCDLCAQGRLNGYIAALTVPTLFYIVRRNADLAKAKATVRMCLESFDVLPVDRESLEFAHGLNSNDFEDGVQIACACLGKMDWIITRDNSLSHPDIRILNPRVALELLADV